MAKRIKRKDDTYTILNFHQADTHLKELATLQRELEALEANADRMINHVKDDLKKQSRPLSEKIQKHVRSLEAFCAEHRDAFGKSQSKRMLFGVLGWRRSTRISVKKSTLQKIKAMLSPAKRYIHVKETPNKDVLDKLTDEQLKQVDARRVRREAFYAEPDMTKIEEAD